MRKIKYILIIFAFAATACTNDNDSVNTEETALSTFWSRQRAADTAGLIVDSIYENGIYKLSFNLGNTSNAIESGDSVFFYYIGGQLTSSGVSRIITTNIDSIAINNGLAGMVGKGIEKGVAGKGKYIKGLDRALTMMNEGEHALVFFSSELAYGDNRLGPLPVNSPLLFEIIITQIKKN